jgi:pimeloyl-ACP methyl ester carboxylesterase
MSHAQINGSELFYRIVGTGWPCFILHGGLGLDHTANSRGFEIMSGYNMLPHLSGIHVPTLCVVGDTDFLALVPHVQTLAQGLPHAEMVVIERCGHLPFIERPTAFLQAVATWLQHRL